MPISFAPILFVFVIGAAIGGSSAAIIQGFQGKKKKPLVPALIGGLILVIIALAYGSHF